MFIVMVLPVLDVVSDFVVLLAVYFFNRIVFALVCFFFVLPSYYFLYFIIATKRIPRWSVLPIRGHTLFWLSSSGTDMCPHINSQPCCRSLIQIPVLGVLAAVSIWPCLVLLQVLYLCLAVVLVILNIPFQLIWLAMGCLLFQTSLWSINRVWSVWLYVWSGDSLEQVIAANSEIYSVSDARLRSSLTYKLILETLFMLVLQPINLFLLNPYGYYNLIGIISIVITVLNILNWIFYVFVYSKNDKSFEATKGLKERSLYPTGHPTPKAIDNALHSMRRGLTFMTSSADRKRIQ
jgi:hypothetical protein